VVAEKAVAEEDDGDAVSSRTPSATQLAIDIVWRLCVARGGRHTGSSPTRKVTIDIDEDYGANGKSSFVVAMGRCDMYCITYCLR
jgi:hypothetical protein